MVLISSGKSNGTLDPSSFLSSLFLSRIVKWSFWLVAKPKAAENRCVCGVHANICWCLGIDTPWVFTLMEFVEFREYSLKSKTLYIFEGRGKKLSSKMFYFTYTFFLSACWDGDCDSICIPWQRYKHAGRKKHQLKYQKTDYMSLF